ncbi:inner membrane CreD family protein [Haloferula sp. A504]|uniref:inner membrane CreD family protein n=1 Tax=Haloferula sp. A504 TaxID=3373601 RepID=UPI0031BFE558|nr:inner membrane CreD family protein [Verrucomicrobiaceae bacterium E54]
MKPLHLLTTAAILAGTALAWFILGAAIGKRNHDFGRSTTDDVSHVWGPSLVQRHPSAFFLTPNAVGGRAAVQPSESSVHVDLGFEPKKRGLLQHRTYQVRYAADYVFTNPTRIPQTLYLNFPLPAAAQGLHEFSLSVDGESADTVSGISSGVITRSVEVPAGETVPLHVSYLTRGTDDWRYEFPDASRISGFDLTMSTDFSEIDFPVGTGSPTDRQQTPDGWRLDWSYPDVIGAHHIGMSMPKLLNAGPVAARIAFFAPVSLLFFVTVVLLIGGLRGVPLHPMHMFFVSAGFFAFHLLFAYLVDLLPAAASFLIAALVSVALVSGYLRAVGGRKLFRVALPAQTAYMVLFSASFFFDGLTGITIAIGAVVTLGILMILTARVDWKTIFASKAAPPPAIPSRT